MAKIREPRRQADGPYLDAALVCEDLVQETGDLAISAIRLVNRITAHDLTPKLGALVPLPLVLLVSFKAGEVIGKRELSLYMVSPSGKRNQPSSFGQRRILSFAGGDTGAVTAVGLALEYEGDGTYWIDVRLDGRSYSRIPLTFLTANRPS
jgi:hypothetical protein